MTEILINLYFLNGVSPAFSSGYKRLGTFVVVNDVFIDGGLQFLDAGEYFAT